MLQADEPRDYVIGTGESHTVREFCDVAFGLVGLNWDDYVRLDEIYLRPTDVEFLQCDSSKAQAELGWTPKTTFAELVELMLVNDLSEVGLDLESAKLAASNLSR